MRTVSVYERLRRSALEEISRRGLGVDDRAAVLALLGALVEDYHRQPGARPLTDPAGMVRRLARSVFEFGPLTPFLDDSIRYEELIIHGEEVSYVDGRGRLVAHAEPISEDEVTHVVTKLLASAGATVDEAHPIVQTQILDGRARLGVVIPPVAERIDVTIRRYLTRRETLEELVAWNALSPSAASFLTLAMTTPTGIIVTGRPGSGKTTVLNALLRAAPPTRRVIVCEDTPELSTDHLHAARWRTRPGGPDGTGEVSLRDLVRMSLGMRPDLVVVGECRGAETFELTRAGNAGCGMLSTIHANGTRQGLMALISTATMAGANVAADQLRQVFSSIIDLVVHTAQAPGPGGVRQITEIAAVSAMQATEHDITVEPLFVRPAIGAPLTWSGSALPTELDRRLGAVAALSGFTPTEVLEGRVTRW